MEEKKKCNQDSKRKYKKLNKKHVPAMLKVQ